MTDSTGVAQIGGLSLSEEDNELDEEDFDDDSDESWEEDFDEDDSE